MPGVTLTVTVSPVMLEVSEAQIVDWFQEIYFRRFVSLPSAKPISWLGWPVMKNPIDLWVYQTLITELKPDLIVETGTFRGGSALYMAVVCEMLDHGEIVSVDIKTPADRAKHQRIEYLVGDSVGDEVLGVVRQRCAGKSVMVILDSDHRKAHVLKELAGYAPLVSPGHYLIVEDTNINGHPVCADWGGPGPWEALEEWLPQHPEFERDNECEHLLLTWNPGGYLKRTHATPTIERTKARRRRK